MNRDTRMWIVVGVAVVAAALATFAMYKVVKGGLRTPEPPKVWTVVAKRNLDMGATVGEADVKLITWPNDSQVPGAFSSIDQVKEKPLIAAVLENEPITKSTVGMSTTISQITSSQAMMVQIKVVLTLRQVDGRKTITLLSCWK